MHRLLQSKTASPSLRGSGLKCEKGVVVGHVIASPSLRGSGLKSKKLVLFGMALLVSLFTREWIEIVSMQGNLQMDALSPSLRGSGLKLIMIWGVA